MRIAVYLRNTRGFTLIELSVVIAIIGILAGIGVNKYEDSTENAKLTVVRNTVSEVQRFIQITAAQNGRYPASLDLNSNAAGPFFEAISYPVYKDWTKRTGNLYEPTNLKYNTLLYQYDAANGLFREVSNNYINPAGTASRLNSFLATNGIRAFPASGTGYSSDGHSWYYNDASLAEDAVYVPWDNLPLTWTTTFAAAGDYTLSFDVKNYATHGASGRDSTWTMPAGYTFQFDVLVDGTKVGTASVAGSDTQYNTGTVSLAGITAGSHTVSLKWTNDSYNESAHRDANAMIKDILIQ